MKGNLSDIGVSLKHAYIPRGIKRKLVTFGINSDHKGQIVRVFFFVTIHCSGKSISST